MEQAAARSSVKAWQLAELPGRGRFSPFPDSFSDKEE